MNDGRYYIMKWNIKQSYHIWTRGFYIDYIGCNEQGGSGSHLTWQCDGHGTDEDGQMTEVLFS